MARWRNSNWSSLIRTAFRGSPALFRRLTATRVLLISCGCALRTWRRRASRYSFTENQAVPFPARQHIESSKAIARAHRLDPAKTLFVQQSEIAIAAGAFHNDVVCSRQRASAVHARAGVRTTRTDLRGHQTADARGGNRHRPSRSHQPRRRNPELFVQCATGHPARWRHGINTAKRSTGQRTRLWDWLSEMVAWQRSDPRAGAGRCPPIDGQWWRPRLPASCASWPTPQRSIGAFLADEEKLDQYCRRDRFIIGRKALRRTNWAMRRVLIEQVKKARAVHYATRAISPNWTKRRKSFTLCVTH